MKKEYILAYDLGTTGAKAVLVHCERGLRATFFVPYSTFYPASTWAEQDPEDWWGAIITGTQGLFQHAGVSASDLACVVFSGQMMGCLPVDPSGAPLHRAIIWADQRATTELHDVLQRLDLPEIYQITGHRIGPAYSAPKIMWIRKHAPHIFYRTHKFLQAKDFVVYRLTGKYVTDYSDACGTGLLDLRAKIWSDKMLEITGIPEEMLPKILPSTAVAGEITKEASVQTGLPAGLPVVVGGGDGVCATAGAGVVAPGMGHVYLGSSAWIAGASETPVFDPKMRTFTWPHLAPQFYSPNGTMHNAGSALEWAKTTLARFETKVAEWLDIGVYELIEKEAERIPPGTEGLIFLPYLMGERSPWWDPHARGVYLGITKKHTAAHLLRAVYEGIALNLRSIFLALQEQKVVFAETRVIGGGAMSRLWTQILADALGTPLHVTAAPLEATALGAAMAGAVGVELVHDFPVAARRFVAAKETIEPGPGSGVYAHLHDVFVEAYQALRKVFERLPGVTGEKDER